MHRDAKTHNVMKLQSALGFVVETSSYIRKKMNNNDKTWMHSRLENGFLTNEFCIGVEAFVAFSLSHPECLSNGKLRCPCNRKKCQNKCYLDEDTVKVHLCRYGFVPNYDCWYFHGEEYVRPFYENVNMDVPTSSYRLPNVDFAPQQYPISDPNYFEHIAGSKTYSAHYHSMQKAARQGTNPTSWDLYLHTHRRADGSFVDERSRLVHQSMETYMVESLTPLDVGTIPDQPSSEEVNNMFKNVVGRRKKRRMYGCGSMTSTMYPQEMAPRPRGGGSASSSSQGTDRLREELEKQNRVIEFLRVDLQTSQRRWDQLERSNNELREENRVLNSRVSSVEEQVRRLVAGIPQVSPTHSRTQPRVRILHGGGTSSRGRSIAHRSQDDRFTTSSSRTAQARTTSLPSHRFSQQWVDPSQGFYDDADGDETQAP